MTFLEQFKNKKIYMIADSDCDGLMCSLLAEYYIKPIATKYIRYNTGDRGLPDFDWDKAKDSDIVLFTDIGPVDKEMSDKIQEISKLIIVDHHETHREMLGEMKNYYYDITKCATKIFFELLTENLQVKKIIYDYVNLTNIYDLYQTDSPLFRNAKGLNNLVYGYIDWKAARWQTDTEKNQEFIYEQLQKIEKSNDFYFTKKEKDMALKAEKKEKDNYKKARQNLSIRIDNAGNKYGYFECSSKLSIVASWLLRDFPDIKYFIGHTTFLETYRNKENGKVSLRSQKDFNIAKIAEKFGGGGHEHASGIELSIDIFKELKKGKIHLN